MSLASKYPCVLAAVNSTAAACLLVFSANCLHANGGVAVMNTHTHTQKTDGYMCGPNLF